MKKKALVVGVSDYGGYATPLPAAEEEARNWAYLLEHTYGFTDITPLIGRDAVRTRVIEELQNLLAEAEPDAQLVYIHCGHGRTVPAHDDGPFAYEEALVVYPEEGDTQLRGAEITDSDLVALFLDAEVPEGTDVTIVPDCCYSARLNVPLPFNAVVQAIPSPMGIQPDKAAVKEFGSLTGAYPFERPIIVASCGRDEQSIQVEVDGSPRLLFSSRAIDHLTRYVQVTYHLLKEDIRPLQEGVNQTPELRGNTTRENELFPGQARRQPPARAASISDATAPRAAAAIHSSTATTSPNQVEIRFKGICCFAQSRSALDPYQRRVLMPYDARYDPAVQHIAFLEIDVDDIESYSGPLPSQVISHTGHPNIKYRLWYLHGHRIWFFNADGSASPRLETTKTFDKHVPGMKEDVYPYLLYHPHDDCFRNPPPATLVSSYADLNCGTLTIGPLEKNKTKFTRKNGTSPTNWLERTPEFTELHLPIKADLAVIYLVPYEAGQPTIINVKNGGPVLIGNARVTDIIEENNPAENPRENFKLYYLLSSKPVGDDPPLPATVGVPVSACSNNGWP